MRPIWKSWLYSRFARKDLKRALAQVKRLEYQLSSRETRFAVPFVYGGERFFRSLTPLQTPAEIERLYRMAIDLNPTRVLEIGTAKGGTLYLWCQAACEDAVLVSVDLPHGKFGGGYDLPRSELYAAFAREKQKLHLLRANSHDPETLDEVVSLFESEPVDFLFLDGDHFYDGVKNDFLSYGPLVKPGGLIALHDILPAPHDAEIEVHLLWEQLKQLAPCEEIIESDAKGWHLGLGVIRVPEGGLPASLVSSLK